MVDFEIILRELLTLPDLSGAQALYINELFGVVMIW